MFGCFITVKLQNFTNCNPAIIFIRPIFINKDISDIKFSANSKFGFDVPLNIFIWESCKILLLLFDNNFLLFIWCESSVNALFKASNFTITKF